MQDQDQEKGLPSSTATTLSSSSAPLLQRLRNALSDQVDPLSSQSTTALVFACFMTGFTSAVTFTACFIWCGFQTGGTIQLALAVARLFSGPHPRSYTFHIPDRQALVSLLSFLVGTSIGRIGDRIGPQRRIWLCISTLAQAGCLMAAALCCLYSREADVAESRGDPSWANPLGLAALGFCSASLGIQGIIGKRLNTQFATAVVLTTIWVELVNDPLLFARRAVKSRDHKASAVAMLFIGGLVSRALLDTIGSSATLGIAAGLRVLGSIGWFWVPTKQVKAKTSG